MSSIDQGGVAVRSEADVVVMSEDNETGDDVLRALRAKQAKLDEAYKEIQKLQKQKSMLERQLKHSLES